MPRRTTPAQSQHSVDDLLQLGCGTVAKRGEVGDQSHKPEQQRDCPVSRDCKNVPDERTAELWPNSHHAGVREHPECIPGTAGMNERKDTGASHGEKCHRLGKPIDGSAPLLVEQKENGGNKCTGVADTDPPHEIDDGEAPADGNVDAPDTHALQDQVADGDVHHAKNAECNQKADVPAKRSGPRQNYSADLVRDRAIRMPRTKYRRQAADLGRIDWRIAGAHAFSNSGFGLRTAARYVVRGRVLSSPRIE